jgi:hypothetical protein
MGYFYNYLEKRWDPINHDRQLNRQQRQQIERKKTLIAGLITEIEASNDSVVKLYVSLAARTLAATDELLLRAHGKRLAELGGGTQKEPEQRRAAG